MIPRLAAALLLLAQPARPHPPGTARAAQAAPGRRRDPHATRSDAAAAAPAAPPRRGRDRRPRRHADRRRGRRGDGLRSRAPRLQGGNADLQALLHHLIGQTPLVLRGPQLQPGLFFRFAPPGPNTQTRWQALLQIFLHHPKGLKFGNWVGFVQEVSSSHFRA